MANSGKLINVNIDLSNLEGLSDAVKILVNRVANEVGDFTKPHHIRRVARAKADAAIIKAETTNKINQIQERGLRRMVIEEGIRQENIETIVTKSIPHIQDDARSDEVDRDWIANFFDKARLVSDSDMQEIWGRLLAEEANHPNGVSRRTIALLATLDKEDAELFTTFCTYLWSFDQLTALILDDKSGPAFENGINFGALTHLDSIGLISFDSHGAFQRVGTASAKRAAISYFGRVLTPEFQSEKFTLSLGKTLLTEAGRQLARVCEPTPSQTYYEYVVERLYRQGITLSSNINNRGFH